MSTSQQQKVLSWLCQIKQRRKRFRLSHKLLCVLLVTLGICCRVCYIMYNSPITTNEVVTNRHKRSRHSFPGPTVLTVQDILNFPKDYHAKGVLSLPYGDIVEPFEAWYSAENKMSRIDYYGGMDQTYQRELMGKYGFACKVVPEFSESTLKTFRGCLHRRGTKRFPVKAQSIVPTSHYFKYVGDVILRGKQAAKWQHTFTIYSKVNTYILYTTKERHVKPLRYEMMGYDTLLSSYYDHYVLDYELFEPWKFDYFKFQIPTNLDCFDFTQRKFSHIVGELNPMLEFMPHTDNGAPFTFSHDPAPKTELVPELTDLVPESTDRWGSSTENFDYPSEGLDASLGDGVSEDKREPSGTFYKTPTVVPHYSYGSSSAGKTRVPPNNRNHWNVYKQYGQPFLHSNWKNNNNNIQNNVQSHRKIHQNVKRRLYKSSTRQRTFYKPGYHRKRKFYSRILAQNTVKVNRGNTLYSWASLRKTKHDNHTTKQRQKTHKYFKQKQGKTKKYLKTRTLTNGRKRPAKSGKSVDQILRQHYEDIVNVLFESFKLDHNKAYSSHREHETRKDIYRHNMRFIMSRNRMHLGYKLRPNPLMDMTDIEIQKQKGLLNDDGDVFNGGIPFKATSDPVPSFIDWRKKGAVGSVHSQGICGSCYAYAVTGALEGAYYLKHGKLPELSEQEIIDCSWGFGNRGCKGGYPYRAMQWILKHGGLATDGSYGKYLAQEGYCHFKNVSIGVTVESYMNISKGNATELKQALAQYGPVSVLINTQPKSFKFYSSGVYHDPECGTNHDHAALAVGYGVENGTPYWLIKNSWSKAWGDSGYIKIAQRGDNCGVTSKAVVVKIK